MKKNLRIILIVILALVVGFAVEYFVNGFITPAPPVVAMPQEPSPTPMVQAISTSTTGYGLLNGDVAWQSGQHFIVNFEPLRSQIASITQEYPQNTYIYFDYLNSSANFGPTRERFLRRRAPLRFRLQWQSIRWQKKEN